MLLFLHIIDDHNVTRTVENPVVGYAIVPGTVDAHWGKKEERAPPEK